MVVRVPSWARIVRPVYFRNTSSSDGRAMDSVLTVMPCASRSCMMLGAADAHAILTHMVTELNLSSGPEASN